MRCPFCGHLETHVVETREAVNGEAVRRRRRCGSCEKRFTTFERAEIELPSIVKRDNRRTGYERAKVRASMMLALRKRSVPVDAVDAALDDIEAHLRGTGEREVASTRLGEWVMAALRKLDTVAYVRYASVYRSFEDASEFVDAVKETRRTRGRTAPSRRER